jgi:hypothetical protein
LAREVAECGHPGLRLPIRDEHVRLTHVINHGQTSNYVGTPVETRELVPDCGELFVARWQRVDMAVRNAASTRRACSDPVLKHKQSLLMFQQMCSEGVERCCHVVAHGRANQRCRAAVIPRDHKRMVPTQRR